MENSDTNHSSDLQQLPSGCRRLGSIGQVWYKYQILKLDTILPHLLGKKVESFIHLHSTNISYIYTYMKDKEVSFGQVRKAKKF